MFHAPRSDSTEKAILVIGETGETMNRGIKTVITKGEPDDEEERDGMKKEL